MSWESQEKTYDIKEVLQCSITDLLTFVYFEGSNEFWAKLKTVGRFPWDLPITLPWLQCCIFVWTFLVLYNDLYYILRLSNKKILEWLNMISPWFRLCKIIPYYIWLVHDSCLCYFTFTSSWLNYVLKNIFITLARFFLTTFRTLFL